MPATNQSTFGIDGSLELPEWPDVDGAERLNREPTDAEKRWGITKEELHRRHMASPTVTNHLERRCGECGKRVTKTPSGDEVGHATGRKDPLCSQHRDAREIAEEYSGRRLPRRPLSNRSNNGLAAQDKEEHHS